MIKGKKLFDKVKPTSDKMAAIGHSYRMAMLYLLSYGEMEAGAISMAMGISETLTSHHLKELYLNGWLLRTRNGRRLIYKLNEKAFYRLSELFIETPFYRDHLSKHIK